MKPPRTSRVALVLALVSAVLAGCKGAGGPKPGVRADRPAPEYTQIARAVNDRADKLRRVWARAVTSFAWTDPDGAKRSEQGEGFFQLVQPSRFALDIGKLGEVMVWAGCDAQRYWFIRLGDERTARVGRHDGPGAERLIQEELPALPRELIDLTGVTPLPTGSRPLSIGWTTEGLWLVETATAYGSLVREIDPRTVEPVRLVLKRSGRPRAVAVLANPSAVERDATSDWARMPTRITVTDPDTGNKLVIALESLSDGIRGRGKGRERLGPDVFSFDTLRERLGVRAVEDLDAPAAAGSTMVR